MTTESPNDELSPQDEPVLETPPVEGGESDSEAMPDAESVDPLSAMAAGMDLNEVDPYLEQQVKAARSLDGLPEEEEEVPAPTAGASAGAGLATPAAAPRPAGGGAAVSSPAASRPSVDRARARAVQAAADSLQFKQFMIPVLMAVGVLLMLIGALSWVYDAGQGGPAWAGMLMLIVQYVAIPLGLLLLIGALYFRMEVKRALRNKR